MEGKRGGGSRRGAGARSPHGRNHAMRGSGSCAGLKEDWGEGRKNHRGEARRRGRTSEKPWQDGSSARARAHIARILLAIFGTGLFTPSVK